MARANLSVNKICYAVAVRCSTCCSYSRSVTTASYSGRSTEFLKLHIRMLRFNIVPFTTTIFCSAAAVGGMFALRRLRWTHSAVYHPRTREDNSLVGGMKFSVAQFNILARNLATRERFPYVKEDVLSWDNRKRILIKQIIELDADILCLEELTDYWTYFKAELEAQGYDSVYVKRPSINLSNWSGRQKEDGCGIFFKRCKFSLDDCHSINFADDHDRVAMFAWLQFKLSKEFILVSNIHVYWNAKMEHTQLQEIKELEQETARQLLIKERPVAPVIICGDFNNSPESAIYQYMTKNFHSGNERSFASAYGSYTGCTNKKKGSQREPPHTTVNFRRCWTIDYIFYSPDSLKVMELLKIPAESELRSEEGPEGWLELSMADDHRGRVPCGIHGNHNGIPNSFQGSDHVPIMAQFQAIKK